MFAARLRISAVGLQRKQFLGKVERIEKVEGVMEKRAKSAGSGVLNPFVDWSFKHLFGTERSKKNLLGFLNLLLDMEYPIVDLRYLNNESILYEMLVYLLIQMRNGMKTTEELKQEIYAHGLNDHIREIFLGVLKDADVASLSEKEKLLYEERFKRHRDNRACLDYAIEDGIKQGIEIGETKGREEGRAEGRVEGRNERNIEIARLMKLKGLDISIIAECTGIGADEIGSI